MAAMSGSTLLVAMCLLHLTVHVEAGLRTLKKPTKPDYTVEIEKVEMISTPRDYLDPKSRFYSVMYNDTARVVNVDFYVLKDFPEDLLGYYYVRDYMQGTDGFVLHLEEDYWRVELSFVTKKSRETLFAVRFEAWTRPIEDDE